MSRFLRSICLLGLLLCALIPGLTAQAQTTPEQEATIKLINDLQATVKNKRALISELRPDVAQQLPVGLIKNSRDSDRPAILIDDIILEPNSATLKAYASIMLPGANSPIYFATGGAVNISYSGGLLNEAKLHLVNNKTIEIGQTKLTIKGGDSTFIVFDCKGFKSACIEIEAELHPNLYKDVGLNTQSSKIPAKSNFKLKFEDLNDIVATVSMEAFQVKDVKNVTFEAQKAVIDLSDFSNSPSMVFPAGYEQDYFGGVNIGLWRGFYLESAKVILPPELKATSGENVTNDNRKALFVKGLLIDNHGFSGELSAKNLLELDEGNVAGWDFSVDSIGLAFRANQLEKAGLKGGIVLPISKEGDSFAYSATFYPGKFYTFNVTTGRKIEIPVFKAADVTIYDNSSVELSYNETSNKFSASAKLHGIMTINVSLTKTENETEEANKGRLPSVKFSNLIISSDAPYIHSGDFSFNSQITLAGLKATINKIEILKNASLKGLGIGLSANLMKGKDAFSAKGDLKILGLIDISNLGRQRFNYKATELSALTLKIDQGSFSLLGSIAFFKHNSTYGSGFQGKIDAKMPLGIRVAATAMFGTVNGRNYWYADALAEFGKGIPICPMLEINGFSGGLYYGVSQKEGGASATGLTYTPDPNVGFGLKAGVMFATSGKKNVVNGTVGFEVVFNGSGGLSRIMLMGKAKFMNQPYPNIVSKVKNAAAAFAKKVKAGEGSDALYNEIDPEAKNGLITASALMDFNFDQRSLYAKFQVSVNMGSAMQGNGHAAMYFAPNTWYIHLGSTEGPGRGQMLNVSVLNFLKTSAYFMVGKNLPGSPPPLPKVSEILGNRNLDYMRDLNALESGMGFAFGAAVEVSTGDLIWGIFFANFSAGAGFDVMLKDYGQNAKCEGGETIGVKGWYANGQVYAYVAGKIGLTAKVFGRRRKFTILDIGAAAILQAKFPNPTWMHGEVGGRYRLLGGLVKGHCSFEFTLGSECNIVGTDALAEKSVRVISELKPGGGETETDVFSNPKALFNMPVGPEFAIKDQQGRDILFRAKLQEFSVKADGSPLEGEIKWNGERTEATFLPFNVLPSKKDITMLVKISIEENVNGNWQTYNSNNKPYVETDTTEFTTGTGPKVIPASNIAYTYPMLNQLNYYKKESRAGYIKLQSSQAELFNPAGFKTIGRLNAVNGTVIPIDDLSYDNSQFSFTMPVLDKDMGYELLLLNMPLQGNDADSAQIFSLNFHTSKYDTFSEKFADLAQSQISLVQVRDRVDQLVYTIKNTELFDDYELNEYNKMLSMEADLSSTSWFHNDVKPYVYEGYPVNNALKLENRDLNALGTIPVRAVYIRNNNNQTGVKYIPGQAAATGDVSIVYNLANYMDGDYWEMKNKVGKIMANKVLKVVVGKNIPQPMKNMVNRQFTPLSNGTYKVKVKYILPGTGTVTSEKVIEINKTN